MYTYARVFEGNCDDELTDDLYSEQSKLGFFFYVRIMVIGADEDCGFDGFLKV
ncbi:hypothetical protein HanIR_Chr15g0768001 [Helianthus annuus]|nr:hypothetical protein HanIR_Chr15g0768001 [Helianthus annuus]